MQAAIRRYLDWRNGVREISVKSWKLYCGLARIEAQYRVGQMGAWFLEHPEGRKYLGYGAAAYNFGPEQWEQLLSSVTRQPR